MLFSLRRTLIVVFALLAACFVWAQRLPRFKTFPWEFEIGSESWTMYVSQDTRNGATLYIPTRPRADGTLEVLGFAVLSSTPSPPPGTFPPPPTPPPVPSPTPSPIPSPPSCDASWQASLAVSTVVRETQVDVTFLADWIQPPSFGWISDNGVQIQQGPINPGKPLTWTYPRLPQDFHNWAYLSLIRGSSDLFRRLYRRGDVLPQGLDLCELVVTYTIPAR